MLDAIFGFFGDVVTFILSALVQFVNLLIEAVAVAVGFFVNLLPVMPAGPEPAQGSWLDWLNWGMPVADLVAGLLVFVGIWVVYLLVRVPLRWLRVL